MPSKWAVLVVHGVGDTGQGVTVDSLVAALALRRPRLQPDGRVEIYQLADKPPDQPQHAPDVTFFPAHVRRAQILPGAGAPAGEPEEAVFAEVYWADLSTVREGTLQLILSLLSTIFLLRFISDQAAVMPDQPTTRSANWARGMARWLRALLHLATSFLCGPIAALSAFLAYVLAAYYLVLLPLKTPADLGMLIVSAIATVGGGIAWLYCSRKHSGSTWTRLWASCAVVATLVVLLAACRYRFPAASESIWRELIRLAQLQLGPWVDARAGVPAYAAVILFMIEAALVLLGAIMLVALMFLIAALFIAPKPWRAALGAAYGAASVQLGLWLLVIPPLALIAARALLPDPDAEKQVTALLATPRGHFLHLLGLSLFVGFVALWVLWSRWRWVQSTAYLRNPPPYSFPPPKPDINRLIVHTLILVTIIGLAMVASSLSLLAFALRWFSFTAAFGRDLRWLLDPIRVELANALTNLLLSSLLLVFGLSRQQLRDGLHIIIDVINHFYQRRHPLPLPLGPERRVRVLDFETQQRIEHRFRQVLFFILADPEVTHLSVVSHSQGTVIAIDVLTLEGLTDQVKREVKDRLGALRRFHLVTMGSPLTHLYQHYFPFRYPPLDDASWDGLKEVICNWVNIYRVDDYIGTFVAPSAGYMTAPDPATAPDPTRLLPSNIAIGPGGHTGYWRQPEVFDFLQIRESLPG
jgi:hypothetical protein